MQVWRPRRQALLLATGLLLVEANAGRHRVAVAGYNLYGQVAMAPRGWNLRPPGV